MKKTFKHARFSAIFTDENGYFSLTGKIAGSSGAVGDRIAAIDGNFKILAAVHLCDSKTGVPMHAVANAVYFRDNGEDDKARASLHIGKQLYTRWRRGELPATELAEYWQSAAEEARKAAEELPYNLCDRFIDPYDNNGDLLPAYVGVDEATIAVAMLEDVDALDIEDYIAAGQEYRVFDEEGADAAWEEELDNYLDECVYPGLTEFARLYFNWALWKHDARIDGRGHWLSSYDGIENLRVVNGTTYFLYRI